MPEHLTASDIKRSLQTRLNDQGTLEDFYRVTYRVSDGTMQSVDIPKDRYTADYVVEIINAELAEYQKTKDAFG